MKKAIILLSGGMDSTTALYSAIKEGYEIHAISFDYGAKLAVEVELARKIAINANVKSHKIVKIDLSLFSGSSLIDVNLEVPKFTTNDVTFEGTPSTYVPARNTIFLSYALAFAETIDAEAIFIGINKEDFLNYPDTRPEYIEAFEKMAEFAIKERTGDKKVTVKTPLAKLDKKGIIKLGNRLSVDYSLTLSCYDPIEGGKSCGMCQSCKLRLNAFRELGLKDPAPYV